MDVVKTVGATSLVLVLGLSMGLAGCATATGGTRASIVKAAPTCPSQTVQIYFEPDSAEVTDEGRAVIKAAAGSAAGCIVKSVDVLGLADAQGAADANLELSKKRAQSVTAALAGAGLPAGEFKVAAAGQTGAVTAAGQAAPLRRRVDVVLHLSKP